MRVKCDAFRYNTEPSCTDVYIDCYLNDLLLANYLAISSCCFFSSGMQDFESDESSLKPGMSDS